MANEKGRYITAGFSLSQIVSNDGRLSKIGHEMAEKRRVKISDLLALDNPKYKDITQEVMESPANIAYDSINPLDSRINGRKWKVGKMGFSANSVAKSTSGFKTGKRGKRGRFEGNELQFRLPIGEGMDISSIVLGAKIDGKKVTLDIANSDDSSSEGFKYRKSTFAAIANAAKKVNGANSHYDFLRDVTVTENGKPVHYHFAMVREDDRTPKEKSAKIEQDDSSDDTESENENES